MTVIDGSSSYVSEEPDDETLQWAANVSAQALQCRDLRHAWPRDFQHSGTTMSTRTVGIVWTVLATYPSGAPAEAERQMECAGGCGTLRTETFRIYPGGAAHRQGAPRYTYAEGFLRPKSRDGGRLGRLDPNQVRGFVLARLFPKIQW